MVACPAVDNEIIVMNKYINIEDNIFVLNTRIRMIRDLLILDTDPDLFLDKTMTDIEFIDTVLEVLLKNLIENTRLIQRNEQFYNLHETEQQFVSVLRDFSSGKSSVSVSPYPILLKKIAVFREHSLERKKTIEEHIGSVEAPSLEPVVSPDELNELLRDY
jgi:hypothetical protein